MCFTFDTFSLRTDWFFSRVFLFCSLCPRSANDRCVFDDVLCTRGFCGWSNVRHSRFAGSVIAFVNLLCNFHRIDGNDRSRRHREVKRRRKKANHQKCHFLSSNVCWNFLWVSLLKLRFSAFVNFVLRFTWFHLCLLFAFERIDSVVHFGWFVCVDVSFSLSFFSHVFLLSSIGSCRSKLLVVVHQARRSTCVRAFKKSTCGSKRQPISDLCCITNESTLAHIATCWLWE